MARLTIARSLRLALLGLTIVLALVAAGGVAFLYATRQTYEDRLAETYQLQTAASRLLAAGIVEEATLRTASGSAAQAQRQAARRAFDLTLADARRLAAGDPVSAADVERAARNERQIRARPERQSAPLSGRSALIALAARQRVRLADARATARRHSRAAIIAAAAGGLLAIVAALLLVGAMVSAMRRPLDRLVEAARRLAAGDLATRVEEDGPGELRALAQAFNAMGEDLQRASARVEGERRRLDTTLRSLTDALVITDRDGVVTHSNPRTGDLVPELEPGVPVAGILPPPAEAVGETTLERSGRSLLVTAAPLQDEGGVVWTVRDATERLRLERLKSEFVATASHELRSPLTSIKGFVELLAAGGENFTGRQREFLQIIELSTNRLVDLVNDLLDVARVEAGRVEIHRRPTDLGDAVREVATLLRPRIDDKDQRLIVEVPPGLPPALADPARVRQILTNLVTNAHLYSERGGTITVAVRDTPHHVCIDVGDDGPGMSADDIEHAFDRFYRGGGEGSAPHPPGTGLGLSIVRSLVELHGGDISITSAPGEGARFTVRLPRAGAGRDAGGAAPRHALHGRRVLVVDDEPEIGALIAARLAPYDVDAVVVNSGAAALEQLRGGGFDAVTLDILMPGMSGFEVLRTLRGDPELRGLPVVVVSVFSGREALAGEWVVPKPIDADELADVLGQAILAGRVRLLVVARGALRRTLGPALAELGIEYEWVTDAYAAAQLCLEHFFEVALIDASLHDREAAMAALDLRGRRLRRSVVLFSEEDGGRMLARLDAEPVPIGDAGATVLSLLEAEPA